MQTPTSFALTVLLVAAPAFASTGLHRGPLPITPGTYVRAGTPCNDPSLAPIFAYDGHALSGPHTSQCHSTLISRHGATYRVRTTCAAMGDGTEARAQSETQVFTLHSTTSLSRHNDRDGAEYRLCPGSTPPVPHG